MKQSCGGVWAVSVVWVFSWQRGDVGVRCACMREACPSTRIAKSGVDKTPPGEGVANLSVESLVERKCVHTATSGKT